MPELSRFRGIIIRIHFREHPPAHFHAVHGEREALISIASMAVLAGSLPASELRLALQWGASHQAELRDAWERAQRLEPPGKIAPLE